MKKYGQIIIVLIIFFTVVFFRRQSSGNSNAVPNNNLNNSVISQNNSSSNTNSSSNNSGSSAYAPSSNSTSNNSAPITQSSSSYKNGVYDGSIEDAFYGSIQVRVTVSGGKLSDVSFLQYPNDNNTSKRINTQAMPMLKSEALQAQSAQVNGVSGASYSSQAFINSLGSALQKAT